MDSKNEIIILEFENETVIGIYRPFKLLVGETASTNFDRLLNGLQNYIDNNPNKNLTIVGDFNIDFLKHGDRTYPRHNLANTLSEFQIHNNLDQLVKEITRHRLINKDGTQILQTSLLDHVYTNGLHVEGVEILPTISSDHDLIKINLTSEARKTQTNKKFVRDWRNYSKDKLLLNLNKRNWDIINSTKDTNTLNDRIEQAVKLSFDMITPWSLVREHGKTFVADLNLKTLQRKKEKETNNTRTGKKLKVWILIQSSEKPIND